MKITAVILDWAGTAVDHGSCAPVGIFVELFARRGVEVSTAEAREPMGTHKREHIRRMSVMPRVAEAWVEANGAAITDEDIDAMYAEAASLQADVAPRFAQPIEGVVELVGELRARGIQVGSTTGYPKGVLDAVRAEAARRGYEPDCAVAASEVQAGRPAPFLCWEAARRLGAWPAHGIVKVGDTVVDVQAGKNAGFWSVGVARTGNLVGLTAAELAALSDAERDRRVAAARATLFDAGADFVIDEPLELLGVLDQIEAL